MGNFVFKTKSPERELEIQFPIPGTGEIDALRRIVKPAKPEEEDVPHKKSKKSKKKLPAATGNGALSSVSALIASLIMIAMDD